jgi:hypothetical protein
MATVSGAGISFSENSQQYTADALAEHLFDESRVIGWRSVATLENPSTMRAQPTWLSQCNQWALPVQYK